MHILLLLPVAVAGLAPAAPEAGSQHTHPELTTPIWRKGVGRSIVVPPVMTPAGMLVATTDNRLLMINPGTGRRIWRRGFKEAVETAPVWTTDPVPGAIVAASAGSRNVIRCLAAASGKERWSLDTGEPAHQMEGNGGRFWILDRAGRLSCRRSDSGAVLWSRETGSWRGPGFVLSEERLFILGRADSLKAVDPETGQTIWSVPVPGLCVAPPAITGSALAVIGFDGHLLLLDPKSGGLLHEEQRERFQSNPVVAVNGSIVTVSDGGVVERRGDGVSWRTDLEMAVSSVAVHAGRYLLVAGVAGRLQALCVDRGTTAWSMDLRGGLVVPPLIRGNEVILATGRGEIHVHKLPG